jgi:hypothetical protein
MFFKNRLDCKKVITITMMLSTCLLFAHNAKAQSVSTFALSSASSFTSPLMTAQSSLMTVVAQQNAPSITTTAFVSGSAIAVRSTAAAVAPKTILGVYYYITQNGTGNYWTGGLGTTNGVYSFNVNLPPGTYNVATWTVDSAYVQTYAPTVSQLTIDSTGKPSIQIISTAITSLPDPTKKRITITANATAVAPKTILGVTYWIVDQSNGANYYTGSLATVPGSIYTKSFDVTAGKTYTVAAWTLDNFYAQTNTPNQTVIVP